ncbi:hypothetical protein Lal_00037067 [Lupinus albus]|nr:hypothetical protein Lal_00037067 [Lupinus albus]
MPPARLPLQEGNHMLKLASAQGLQTGVALTTLKRSGLSGEDHGRYPARTPLRQFQRVLSDLPERARAPGQPAAALPGVDAGTVESLAAADHAPVVVAGGGPVLRLWFCLGRALHGGEEPASHLPPSALLLHGRLGDVLANAHGAGLVLETFISRPKTPEPRHAGGSALPQAPARLQRHGGVRHGCHRRRDVFLGGSAGPAILLQRLRQLGVDGLLYPCHQRFFLPGFGQYRRVEHEQAIDPRQLDGAGIGHQGPAVHVIGDAAVPAAAAAAAGIGLDRGHPALFAHAREQLLQLSQAQLGGAPHLLHAHHGRFHAHAGRMQEFQDLDGIDEFRARRRHVPPAFIAHHRQRCGEQRPEERDHPHHVDPHQEDRQHRHRAIDHGVGRELQDVGREETLGDFQPDAGQQAAGGRIAPVHGLVGHGAVEQRVGQRGEHQRDQRIKARPQPRQALDRTASGGRQIRGHADGNPDQERPQRDDGPVHQHPLHQRTGLLDAPDLVEHALDGGHGQHRGQDQEHPAHGRDARRFGGELVQVAQDGVGHALGHEVLDEVGFQRGAEGREQREGRKQRQRDGQHRHQREDGGEGQAAGYLRQAVLAQSPGGEAQQVAELLTGTRIPGCTVPSGLNQAAAQQAGLQGARRQVWRLSPKRAAKSRKNAWQTQSFCFLLGQMKKKRGCIGFSCCLGAKKRKYNKSHDDLFDRPFRADLLQRHHSGALLFAPWCHPQAGRTDRPGRGKRARLRCPPAYRTGGLHRHRSGGTGRAKLGRPLRGSQRPGRMRRPGPGFAHALWQHGSGHEVFLGWHFAAVALRRPGRQAGLRLHLHRQPAWRPGIDALEHDAAAAAPRHAHCGPALFASRTDEHLQRRHALRCQPLGGRQRQSAACPLLLPRRQFQPDRPDPAVPGVGTGAGAAAAGRLVDGVESGAAAAAAARRVEARCLYAAMVLHADPGLSGRGPGARHQRQRPCLGAAGLGRSGADHAVFRLRAGVFTSVQEGRQGNRPPGHPEGLPVSFSPSTTARRLAWRAPLS